MAAVVLGPVSVEARLCHQSERSGVGDVVVLSPSPLVSLAARIRRSEPSLPWSTSEVEDDMWDPGVSDSAFKWIFLFSYLNE